MSAISPASGAWAADQKIQPRHHERLAVVYVRQSSRHQVEQHRESTRLQYGLAERARALGWPPQRILTIDEDQGLSGASAAQRRGFQRLLSEVALDHVGLILGVEMSRLARSCKDWHQLLELCALCGTLICDLDGLYDPSAYNDRLLLGLKGTMSEAELHILQQRMLQGARQKARRGELITRLPIGYVRDASGQVRLDPDEQVQTAIHHVFALFARIGTVSGVVKHLHRHGVQLGVRLEGGPEAGKLVWRAPNLSTLRNMLRHPMYAGAYAYGRRRTQKRPDGRHRSWQSPQQWLVLLRDRFPAYINWAQHQANLEQLRDNRSHHEALGTARRGRALLAGLVVCGHCGHRMFTRYAGKASQPRYCCELKKIAYGQPACQGLAARALDDLVTHVALKALEPAALELSLQVTQDLQAQREREQTVWRQRLERADYEVDRTRRQYEAVEPEHRLVARTLEQEWEQKLQAHRELTEAHERFVHEQPHLLSAIQQQQIRALAGNLPNLWHAPTTTDQERKTILRQVIDQARVTVLGDTEWVEVNIRWAGGHQTHAHLRRPVRRLEQLDDWAAIRCTILELNHQGLRAPRIAERLNHEGWRTPRGQPFTGDRVRHWLSREGKTMLRRSRSQDHCRLGPDEWLVPDLARHLRISHSTIRAWIQRGQIHARQVEGRYSRWVVKADEATLRRCMGRRNPSP